MSKESFTVYRTIRIDGQYDTDKKDSVDAAIETAVQKTIHDALSHSHTIEDGVEVTDITDCGDSI